MISAVGTTKIASEARSYKIASEARSYKIASEARSYGAGGAKPLE